MLQGFIAIILLLTGIGTGEVNWFIASGIFEIASVLSFWREDKQWQKKHHYKKKTKLKKKIKEKKITLRELYITKNAEIKITRLSDIRIGRITPTNQEIHILDQYLKLTENEIEQLEDMRINKLLIESDNRINKLLSLVPKELKAGEFIITRCPNCDDKLKIARAKLKDHLWIENEKESVLICQWQKIKR